MSVSLECANYTRLPSSSEVKVGQVAFKGSMMQVCERNVYWIRENFFGHTNYYNYTMMDGTTGPLVVSYVPNGNCYKILICTIYGCERFSVDVSEIPIAFWRRVLSMGPNIKSILDVVNYRIPEKCLKRCRNRRFSKALLEMEERQVIKSYKFGVLYAAAGQTTEWEMLRNRSSSPEFEKFLEFLGQKIDLGNWKFYRGGLDTTGSCLTGTSSVYTKWQDYEIMFHISTMLPYSESDTQQIERKRHIGNDIVIVVFQESKHYPIKIQSFLSRQNHVIVVVHSIDPESYEVVILYKKGVPVNLSSQDVVEPSIIRKDPASRDYFLSRLIYGERASYESPEFAPKILRTRTVLLTDLLATFGD